MVELWGFIPNLDGGNSHLWTALCNRQLIQKGYAFLQGFNPV